MEVAPAVAVPEVEVVGKVKGLLASDNRRFDTSVEVGMLEVSTAADGASGTETRSGKMYPDSAWAEEDEEGTICA